MKQWKVLYYKSDQDRLDKTKSEQLFTEFNKAVDFFYMVVNNCMGEVCFLHPEHMEKNYRIVKPDGKIKFAGSGHDSWFTLEEARSLVSDGEMIYEYNSNGERLWEIL